MADMITVETRCIPIPISPKYGLYFFAPYIGMLMAFLCLGGTIVAFSYQLDNRIYFNLGISIALYGLLTTLGWALARYIIPGNRVAVARKILFELGLSGNEHILDIGSGRGLYAIEAAKNLQEGKVVAIDIWNPTDTKKLVFHHRLSQPTGNTMENARKNAVLEGVAEKIEFINMDAGHLEFPEAHFEVVICGFVLSHLWKFQDDVLQEIRRVLKQGGRIVLIDNVRDITYFLLSTPHMFIWSFIKGRKARRLSEKNWIMTFNRAKFNIRKWWVRRGIICIEARKE